MSEQPQQAGGRQASDALSRAQSAPAQPSEATSIPTSREAEPPTTSIFRSSRFWLLVPLVAVFIIALVSSSSDTDDTATTAAPTPEATTAENPTSTPTSQPQPTPEAEPALQAQSYSGSGDARVSIPEPIEDVVIVTTEHSGGDGDVIVESLNEDGESADLLANGVGGQFQATRLTNLQPDSTLAALEVSAPGDWTVDIRPITDARRWDTSSDLAGRWDDVVIIEQGSFAAPHNLAYEAAGDGTFVVEVLTAEGRGELVVNDTAPAQGEGIMPANPLIMQISTGNGPWTLRKS